MVNENMLSYQTNCDLQKGSQGNLNTLQVASPGLSFSFLHEPGARGSECNGRWPGGLRVGDVFGAGHNG